MVFLQGRGIILEGASNAKGKILMCKHVREYDVLIFVIART